MGSTNGNQVGHARQVKETPVIGSHAVLVPHRQRDHDGSIAFLANDALHALTNMMPGTLNGDLSRHPWRIPHHQRKAPDRADGAHIPGKKMRLRIKTMGIHARPGSLEHQRRAPYLSWHDDICRLIAPWGGHSTPPIYRQMPRNP